MRKSFLTVITASVIMFTSCNSSKSKENQEKSANDSLREIIENDKEVIRNFETVINDIENNLDSIGGQQKNIAERINSPEKIRSYSDLINKDIITINSIIKSNRNKIAEINKKLSEEKEKNKNLEEKIINLNWDLSEKQYELMSLKENLDDYKTGFMALETAFDYLELDNVALAETVTDETDQLHSAYYITGSLKQLQKDSVLDRKGGFLGLGKNKTLKNQFSQLKFKKIDYSKTPTIPIYAKKVSIVTHHASGSYHLNKEKDKIQSLTITDPVKFWEVSKYLVIIKE